eukprot:TRINITY_DN2430_c0_g1_i2.p1 TRINITY_DN2430_c0_g1~~TRINITY_DN2430_c0_g1_i2.p1  ORF type:complete len:389 (+),score=66.46 TRINITY_DN2430_c0_g1_i2:99-1265(+)
MTSFFRRPPRTEPIFFMNDQEFHAAVLDHDLQRLNVSLKSPHVNVNSYNNEGQSALHYACKICSVELVEKLVEHKDTNANITDKYGWSPIHDLAVSFQEIKDDQISQHSKNALLILQKLFANGADLWKVNESNNCFLHKLLESWRCRVQPEFQMILDVTMRARRANINIRNANGDTPLMLACENRNPQVEIIQILLRNGANPNLANNRGSTCSFLAAFNGSLAILKVLHNNKANVFAPCGCLTPRDIAFIEGHSELVDFLDSIKQRSSQDLLEDSHATFLNVVNQDEFFGQAQSKNFQKVLKKISSQLLVAHPPQRTVANDGRRTLLSSSASSLSNSFSGVNLSPLETKLPTHSSPFLLCELQFQLKHEDVIVPEQEINYNHVLSKHS